MQIETNQKVCFFLCGSCKEAELCQEKCGMGKSVLWYILFIQYIVLIIKIKHLFYEDSSFEAKTFKTLFTKMPAQMSRAPLTLQRVLTDKKQRLVSNANISLLFISDVFVFPFLVQLTLDI